MSYLQKCGLVYSQVRCPHCNTHYRVIERLDDISLEYYNSPEWCEACGKPFYMDRIIPDPIFKSHIDRC